MCSGEAGDELHRCLVCNCAKKKRSEVALHIAVDHMDLLVYVCHLCGHLGNNLYRMEKHMNGHGFTREKDKVAIASRF